MKVLAFDPSGNWLEGKGTTGWALYYESKLTSVGQISAKGYEDRQFYWNAHIDLIKAVEPDFVVMENYVLYGHTKEAQIGSEFETPQLIGILKHFCDWQQIPWYLQHAKIKNRFTNEILLRKGIVEKKPNSTRYYAIGIPLSGHILDAIRHGEFFIQFTLPKILKQRENLNGHTS